MSVYAPRLRILLDPIYIGAASLHGSSTYVRFIRLVKELVARGHFVYWCVPDSPDYTPDPIESHPNVGVIRTSYIQDQFVIDGLVTNEFFNLFNRISGQYHIDAIVTSRVSLALLYKRLIEPPRFHDVETNFTDKGYGIPVAILEGFPQTRKRQHVSRSYWLSQCLGYIASDRTIFTSAHNREEIVNEMQDYIVTSQVRKWLDTTRLIPPGIDVAELDKLYDPDRWKVEKGFQVLCLGRLFSVSHNEFVPWFDYLFKSGMDDVCLTISLSGGLGGPTRAKLKKLGFDFANVGKQFIIKTRNPRSNFIRMLRKFHCFICPLSHVDHPMGIFEALYMGVPGIIPVSDYQQTFFKDYPFVIEPRKKEQLIAMLMDIRKDPQKARDMIAPWRDKIRDEYNLNKNIKVIADEIEEIAHAHIDRFKTSKAVLDFLGELKGKKYTFDDVVAYLRKAGYMGISVGNMDVRQTFTYCRGAIHHAMRYVGYIDTCEGAEDVFVRRDVFDNSKKEIRNVKSKKASG